MFLCFMENYSSFPPILHIKQYLQIIFDGYTFEINKVSKVKIFINGDFVYHKGKPAIGIQWKGSSKKTLLPFPNNSTPRGYLW